MDTYMSLLQSYSGRDKILRTLGYTTVFLSGAVKGKSQQDLLTIAGEFSHTRLVLRLFDDLPMLGMTIKSIKEKDPDKMRKWLTVAGNISILLFFPCEKIAWLSDAKVISWPSYFFSKAGVACWATFLVFNLIKSIRTLLHIRKRRAHLMKMKKLEAPEATLAADLRSTRSQEVVEYATLLKNSADFVMAINFLPPGFLWSEKIPAPRNAIFGIISSIIGTALMLRKDAAAKKEV